MPATAVILAAGIGTRMKSDLPKVLHPLLGEPMITYVVRALRAAGAERILAVLGHGGALVEKALGADIIPVYQEQQLGTGHALLLALPQLLSLGEDDCLVVCGDTPLLTGETLAGLRRRRLETAAAAAVLTAVVENPSGYGRIVAEGDEIKAIVEEKDSDVSQRLIREVNGGAYCFDLPSLRRALEQLRPANAQGDYDLTDGIHYLGAAGRRVVACRAPAAEIAGVNDRAQLAQAQSYLRQRILERHMLAGVTVEDPLSTFVGPLAEIGRDTVLEPGVQLLGATVVGPNCRLGPRSRITDCRIGAGTTVDQS
ncbi:MAG: NTP transferase domain-containing protein, partial [Peptococcaceae bacterium]|nr:NTP transferase domain-containing protein [Peptococcaceae bacterium]